MAFWLLGALLGGAGAGLLATQVSPYAVLAVFGGVALLIVVVWRYEIGACVAIALNSLDVYGIVVRVPVTITWYQVALIMTLGSWMLAWYWRPGNRPRLSVVDLGMGALVFAAVWSYPFSLDHRATLIAAVRLAFLWAFVLLYANALSKPKMAEAMVWTLMASASFSSLWAMAQLWVPGFTYGSVRVVSDFGVLSLRAGAFFHDPNYLAGFLAVSFLTAVAVLVHARRWIRAMLSAGAVAVIGVGLILTLSRTGMVGVAVGVLIVLVTAPRRRRLLLLGALAAVVALVLLAGSQSLINRIRSIGDVNSDRSISTRVWMYASTWEMFKSRWAFGTGLAAFYKTYPQYRFVAAVSDVIRPHEIPLAVAAETGIAGVIAQMVLIWSVVVTFVHERLDGWSVYESLALAAIVSLTIQSLFQYYLYFEYLWLFVAFGVAANRMARRKEVSDV
jgi:O-antigen ligase